MYIISEGRTQVIAKLIHHSVHMKFSTESRGWLGRGAARVPKNPYYSMWQHWRWHGCCMFGWVKQLSTLNT